MLYLANPSTAAIRAEITGFRLGAILTPRQGNRLPADGFYAIDNGCGPTSKGEPGSGYPGDEAYLHMLSKAAEAEGADPCDPDTHRCLFAVAPDVLADAEATLARSHPMLGWIDYFGFRPAFVAQNGQEHLPVPWDDFKALFLGGSAECARCGYVRAAHRARPAAVPLLPAAAGRVEARRRRPPARRRGPGPRQVGPHGPRQLADAAAVRREDRLRLLRRHLPHQGSRQAPPGRARLGGGR